MKDAIKKVLIVLLVFSMVVPTYAGISTNASDWARNSIEKAYNYGIVPDSLLQKCKENITRKEFCELAMNFYEAVTESSKTTLAPSPFHDEKSPYVAKAAELGIVSGVSGTTFMPNDPLMREQIAVLMVNTLRACNARLELDGKANSYFLDGAAISDYAQAPVKFLAQQNVINGYKGYFYPKSYITVEQAISMFLNAYERFNIDPVIINGVSIKIGESKDSLISKMGEPDRIDKNEFGFDRYIYNNDYLKFAMVGIKDGAVAEIFTNCNNFEYDSIISGSKLKNMAAVKSDKKQLDSVIINKYFTTASVCLDPSEEYSVDSVYVIDSYIKNDFKSYNEQLAEYASMELFDMINAARAKRGLNLLLWDNTAALCAKTHSEDMKAQEFASYNNVDGLTPFERMKNAGIKFTMAAENICIDERDVILIYNQWMSAAGTRSNILNSEFTNAGVGSAINGFRIYTTIDLYK